MGNLLAYSGITTKVRAMEGHLISEHQYRELCRLESVEAAADYLKNLPAYGDLFFNLDDSMLHRANIERLLTISLYRDFSKLYRFSDQGQRRFLDLYFMHFEITIIKRCLRNVLGHQQTDINLASFQDFFNRHSKLDLAKLEHSETIEEFISGLSGSPYFILLDHLKNTRNPTIFDYEMHLDLLYFQHVIVTTEKRLSKQDREIMLQCFGTNLDILNIQWILRSKKYYHLDDVDIFTLLIPHHHRLRNEQIKKMVEAVTLDDFYAVLQQTRYGGIRLDLAEPPDLEALYQTILDKIHADTSRNNPYSIASLNSYLYFKEAEIQKIIRIIESIRYGIDGNEILLYMQKQ